MKTLSLTALAAAWMAMAPLAPAQAFDLENMTDAERSAFGAAVRSYLMENPEVILEAVDLLEQQKAEDEAARTAALLAEYLPVLQDDGYSFVGGNPDGDITLVEFIDYRCGYCRRAAPEIEALLKSDGNIRLVVKEFPILGEASLALSRFAIATKRVAGDAAYKSAHDALIAFSGNPTEAALRRLAQGLNLDAEAILAEMGSEEITQQLRDTRQQAELLAIQGTPTFVLEDELLRGYLPAAQMAVMIKDIREKRG